MPPTSSAMVPPSKFSPGPRSNVWFRFLVLCLVISSSVVQSAVTGTANVLIYSATRGYRHDSIPTAIQALKSRSAGYNITFEDTEDSTWFRDDGLRKYDAIVFLSTTGESKSLRSYSISFGLNRLVFRQS